MQRYDDYDKAGIDLMQERLNEWFPESNIDLSPLKDRLPIQIGTIADMIPDLKVIFSKHMDNKQSGSLMFNEKTEKYVCKINEKHSTVRQRFTLAHELGHYILHKEQATVGFVERTDKIYEESARPLETDANKFALDLLMPEKIFIAIYTEYNGNLMAIGNYLLCSMRVVEILAINLGLRTMTRDLLT